MKSQSPLLGDLGNVETKKQIPFLSALLSPPRLPARQRAEETSFTCFSLQSPTYHWKGGGEVRISVCKCLKQERQNERLSHTGSKGACRSEGLFSTLLRAPQATSRTLASSVMFVL